ncbi:hypothetical protein EPR50_G00092530 [Perca flavescens]|uniref:Uncharacterized protein n=1 Tax=Perca flavescens TaxID=8167 RepID=A0A484D3F0_PERFV|nr:hypothetical protein EPR50_G00092530 [Perca flavescens]
MTKVQMLRSLVEQRLTAAAEEIFGLFERTIAEYEEELCRSKEKNERQQKLLDAVFNPQLRLHRADHTVIPPPPDKVGPPPPLLIQEEIRSEICQSTERFTQPLGGLSEVPPPSPIYASSCCQTSPDEIYW